MGTIIYDGLNWVRDALEKNNVSLRTLFTQQCRKNPEDTIFWVWEGKGGNNRRRKLHPDYKTNRVKPHEDIFRSVKLFRDALAFAPVYQVQVDSYEGDDAVATLARWLQYESPVHIWSTDKDFRALCASPNVTCSANVIKDVDDEFVHLYKTLVGDPSDCIKGLAGFGHKAFLDCDQEFLRAQFSRGNFHDFSMDFARIKPKLYQQLQLDKDRIETYWKITEFFEIPRDDLARGITPPTTNDFVGGTNLFNKYLIY